MSFRKLIVCSLFITPMIGSASSLTSISEQMERDAVSQQAIAYTVSHDWAKLDAMIEEYNNGFPTTSGGTHKLVMAWEGIYDLYSVDVSDKGIGDVANQWLKARPNSTGARMLQAMVFNAKAVAIRGQGAASTVDSDAWPKYEKLMQQEKAFLLKNKDIADKDATWYQEMEMVARNLGDKDLLYSTLEEGSKKYPTYQNIYLQAMEGRLPKWGGSAQEVEKIARIAAEKNKAQSGLSYYTYIWYNALSFQPEMMNLLNKREVVSWEDMLQGFNDRYKQFPSPRTLNNFLSTACIADDKSAFMKADQQIAGKIEPQVWPRGLSYQDCKRYFNK
ncbi:DUF4034 domain-containing protein [Salmonella enterica]|nr:DUF4034 domain-containing protein [Salmonella enterica]